MFQSAASGDDPAVEEQAGKADLLIRFFQSQWFDEWIALTCVPPTRTAVLPSERACLALMRLFEP